MTINELHIEFNESDPDGLRGKYGHKIYGYLLPPLPGEIYVVTASFYGRFLFNNRVTSPKNTILLCFSVNSYNSIICLSTACGFSNVSQTSP